MKTRSPMLLSGTLLYYRFKVFFKEKLASICFEFGYLSYRD